MVPSIAATPSLHAWVHELSRPDLEDVFGATSVRRAVTYQRRGAVHQLTADRDGALSATVYGTLRYRTRVWWEPLDDGDELDPDDVFSECSCPVGDSCKHAAALLLQAQARWAPAAHPSGGRTGGRTGAGTGGAPREPLLDPTPSAPTTWETILAPVVAAVGSEAEGGSPVAGRSPLALLLEVDAGSGWRGGARRGLRMRPLVRGASGQWIRTGITWSAVQHRIGGARLDPAHVEALGSLVRAHVAAGPAWGGVGDWVGAGTLGKDLWRLLDDAVAAGVVLVTGHRGQHPVQLLPDAVEVELDVTRAPAGELVLRPRLTVPGATGTPMAMGAPPHGVVAAAGQGLVLGRLARPLSGPMAQLLNSVDLLSVPVEDAERFLTGYYPALRRAARVRSSDGSVELPEVAPPRLGLEVAFEAEHRTRVRWSFRYAVGEQVLEVPLEAGPGQAQDPVLRDRAQEAALLAGLGVLDTVPGLRQHGAGGPVLMARTVLEGWPTVQLVREVLPVLQARPDVDVTLLGEPLDYAESSEAPLVTVSTTDLPVDADGSPGGEVADIADPAHGGQQQDWFDLSITVTVGGSPVPLTGLLTALSRGDQRMILPDGTWFGLDARELHTLRDLVEEARALQDHPSETCGSTATRRGCGRSWSRSASSPSRASGGSARWGRSWRWMSCRIRRCRTGWTRRCATTSSRVTGGCPSSGTTSWAGCWPTTWDWARPCRRLPRRSGHARRAGSPPIDRCWSWRPRASSAPG